MLVAIGESFSSKRACVAVVTKEFRLSVMDACSRDFPDAALSFVPSQASSAYPC